MAHGNMNSSDSSPASSGGTPGRGSTFSALRNPNYRYLWISSAFISAGNQVQQIAMGWLVYELTQSAFWVGTVLGIRALPILLVGPLAGVAIDRLDRKKIYLAAQLGLVVIALVFALDVHFDHATKWHALIFSFLLGLDASVNNPVRQAMVVNTVPPEHLTNAIALNNAASGVMQSIAPLISGALIATLGVAGNFFIQGGAFLAVFFIILPIKLPYREPAKAQASVFKSMGEGIHHIRGDLPLLLLIVLVFIPSLFIHSTQNLLSVFAVDIFGGGPVLLGLLGAAIGIGSLAATLMIASLGNFQTRGRLNMAFIILVTVCLILFGLSSSLGVSLVILGVLGFFNTGFRLVNNALVQSRTPDALRGRITSIYVMDHGFQPLGSLLLGFLAAGGVLGPQKAVVLAGIVALVVTVFIGFKFRLLWRLK
ncbi:MAG: MFS transporter [Dehalococcoidia bacterium]|nr:MFS transporter [Dehalococcoidia bacterium]MSQ16833.1 MFS transporter [Dehalococcoidia bacterium]